ncbi:MAG: hypothetical protein WEB57_13585 [Pseudohongiellaceae bacterium]
MNGRRLMHDVRFWAVLTSLLLSGVAVMLGQFPNDDGFIYLRTAEIFLEQGTLAAFQHYPWATISILIGLLQHLPGIDLFAAAQLLNALWFALVTAVFISLVRHFDDSPRVVMLAALTVLAYPHLNEFRFYIIRDIAFLGLSLWAALCFLRYYVDGTLRQAAGFCGLLVAAALFRAEALLFLALVPLTLLVHPVLSGRLRLRRLLTIWGLAALAPAMAVLIFTLAGVDLWQQLQTAASVYLPFLQDTLAGITGRQAALTDALFSEHAANYASEYTTLVLVTGLLAMLVAKLIESLGPGSAILAYGLYKRQLSLDPLLLRPWWGWLGTALLILVLFTLVARFMTTRYALLAAMLLMVLVPLIVDRLWTAARHSGRMRGFGWLFGLLLTYNAVDAHISYGEPKTWLPDALEWLDANWDARTPLLTNERYIAWRSGRIDAYDEVQRDMPAEALLTAPEGTILVVERQPALYEALQAASGQGQLEELARFTDRRGPRIIIWRRR